MDCAGRESNPGLTRGRGVYYHCTTGAQATNALTHLRALVGPSSQNKISVTRIERVISRVLGERHDQLAHTDAVSGVSGFRSQYLVVANDARFQLRQYPTPTPRGFEPLRARHIRLAGEPLDHSGKVSSPRCQVADTPKIGCNQMEHKSDTFSICACHPCAGAMLIFSVSFQF